MLLLLLFSCRAIDGAVFMQATEAHRLAFALSAGKCWGLNVLDTPEQLPSCVPGPSQPHDEANALAERLRNMADGASASEKLWLGLNAQRAGSVRSFMVGVDLVNEALDEGLPVEELRQVRPWLMRPSALVHVLQWEGAQAVLEGKDPALEAAWTQREKALAAARPWSVESLRACGEASPELVSQFEAAMALQDRLERLDRGQPAAP